MWMAWRAAFMALLDGLLLQRIEDGDAWRPETSVRRARALLDLLLAAPATSTGDVVPTA